ASSTHTTTSSTTAVTPGTSSSISPGKSCRSDTGNGHIGHDQRDLVLLVAALSACHMLWYLHLCSVKGVVVTAYEDRAEGTMVEEPGKGRFTEVTLHPKVEITADSDPERAAALHGRAHAECFIANSVNFPVRCEPRITVTPAGKR
ncbi:MAG: hypothetical protein GY791_17770, partial [Alphaproteobacteria bacterium]|nr:hypothetical protein [Alphaproteobacteria bacterium]